MQLTGTVCYCYPVAQHSDINGDNGNGSDWKERYATKRRH